MRGRSDRRIIEERSQSDVDEGAIADDRIQQRTAPTAVNIVGALVTKDQKCFPASSNFELASFNPGEWLECGARRSATLRAMAIQGVEELVLHNVADCSAQTVTG